MGNVVVVVVAVALLVVAFDGVLFYFYFNTALQLMRPRGLRIS